MSGSVLEVAADLAAFGIDPFKLMNANDQLEVSFMEKLRDKVIERKDIMDQNLANKIAGEISKLF
jgi:hypothetical protein